MLSKRQLVNMHKEIHLKFVRFLRLNFYSQLAFLVVSDLPLGKPDGGDAEARGEKVLAQMAAVGI
ncbi:MAG: hypothetical protein LBL83_06535 [Clostridiales bacterium]|nr:hypothetical protein [Clostridiales bacterium]